MAADKDSTEQAPQQRRSKGNSSQYGQQVFVPATQNFGAVPIPSQIHSAFSGIGNYADPAQAPAGIADTAQFLQSARDQLENINSFRQNADPTQTESAHVLAVNQLTTRTVGTISKQFDAARSALNRAEELYQRQITEQTKLIQTGNAAEIRTVFRSMKPEERHAAIIAAVQADDAETLAAVLGGNALTAGLTAEQQTNLREMHQRRKAAGAFASLEAVKKAQRNLYNAFDSVLSIADELGLAGRAAKLEEARKASMAAQEHARIEAAITPAGRF